MVAFSNSSHLLIVLGLVPIAVAVVIYSPGKTLYALVVWTVFLGLFRRIIPSGGNATLSGDPLLLVAPFIIVLLLIVSITRGSLKYRSSLANAVALLTLVAIVEATNPLQGSLRVGLGGILYLALPMFAFWIGRALLDKRTLKRLMNLVAVLAIFEAIYGLDQTLAGFPSWDVKWLHTAGYTALSVGGSTRAFGTFSSSTEYALFLGIGLICWIALMRGAGRRRLLFGICASALLGTALILDSSRSTVLLPVVALGVMASARLGRRLSGALIAVVISLGILIVVAGQFVGTQATTRPTSPNSTQNISAFTGHLVSGLADPTGKQSTLGAHTGELIQGLKESVTQPLGQGTGSVSQAATHFTGHSLGTEVDPGNAGVAFGVVGVLLYILVALRTFTTAYSEASTRRDAISLAVLGISVVTFLRWLNGDLYSVAWFFWLTIGWIDLERSTWRQRLSESEKMESRIVGESRTAPLSVGR